MEIFDILIVGGGPSALYEAAVLSKTDLNVAIISESFGGCMEMLGDQRLQSYIDELEILDAERRLTNYIKNSTALNPTGQEYSSYIRDCIFDLKIKHIYGKVTHITKSESYFKIQQYKKKVFFARKVILATGIISKKPELALRSRYWISCFEVYNHIYSNQLERYVNQEICIVGGGNTAFQLASILSKKAKNITLLVKRYLGLFPQETDDRFALRAHSQQTIELLTKTSRTDIRGPINVSKQNTHASIWLHAFSELHWDDPSGIFRALIPLELNQHPLLASSTETARTWNRLQYTCKNTFELKFNTENTIFISAIGVQGNFPEFPWKEIIDANSGFLIHDKGSTSIDGLYVAGTLAGYPSVNTMDATSLSQSVIPSLTQSKILSKGIKDSVLSY